MLFDEPGNVFVCSLKITEVEAAPLGESTVRADSCMADVIDRHSSVPYYLQLAQALEREIRLRLRQPGDALPAESELCRHYGLARSTVRQTLRMLVDRGCIRVVPRRGAFVAYPNELGWVLQATEGFFEGEAAHDRRPVQTDVIGAGQAPLPTAAAQALKPPVSGIHRAGKGGRFGATLKVRHRFSRTH